MRNSQAEQESFFKNVILTVSDPILILQADPENKERQVIIFSNHAFGELSGLEPEYVTGDFSGLFGKLGVNISDLKSIHDVIISRQSSTTEITITREDGSDLIAEFKIVPYENRGSESLQWICLLKDITEFKKEEISLRESEEFNRTVLESSPDCLKILDKEGRLQFMNFNGLCQMEIDDFKVIKEKLWWNLWGKENEALVKSAVDKALAGEIAQFVAACNTAKGTPKWWDVTVSPVSNSANEIYQLLSVSRDITEQKEAEKKILQLNTNLEEKVKARTNELLEKNADLQSSIEELATLNYIASHDLQEPLRKIQFFTNLILERDEKLREEHFHFGKILNATDRMRNLIDAINKLANTRNATMNFLECDLNAILSEITEFMQETIREKKAVVEFDKLPVVHGVDILLSQLFLNLIENSLKYSRTGVPSKIHISASELEAGKFDHPVLDKSKNYHKICISDNGIGFDSEYKDKIFGLFQRLHAKEEFSGTGVGLTICKKIAEKHGGWIEAEGVADEGCTFMVYLPKL